MTVNSLMKRRSPMFWDSTVVLAGILVQSILSGLILFRVGAFHASTFSKVFGVLCCLLPIAWGIYFCRDIYCNLSHEYRRKASPNAPVTSPMFSDISDDVIMMLILSMFEGVILIAIWLSDTKSALSPQTDFLTTVFVGVLSLIPVLVFGIIPLRSTYNEHLDKIRDKSYRRISHYTSVDGYLSGGSPYHSDMFH